ncbi:MAG TPA: hypothetical protein VIH71_01575 [Solirubrobacteraceae bacterium]
MAAPGEHPPLTPAQRVLARRHVADLVEWVAHVKGLLVDSPDEDNSGVERKLAQREGELSRFRALLAR